MVKRDPDEPDRAFLEDTVWELTASPTVYDTEHCTGQRQYALLKQQMGSRLHSLSTGTVIEL